MAFDILKRASSVIETLFPMEPSVVYGVVNVLHLSVTAVPVVSASVFTGHFAKFNLPVEPFIMPQEEFIEWQRTVDPAAYVNAHLALVSEAKAEIVAREEKATFERLKKKFAA